MFWANVIAALRTVVPAIGEPSRIVPGPIPAVEPMLTALLNELAGVPHDVVLVLDDYHVIEDAAVHEGDGVPAGPPAGAARTS